MKNLTLLLVAICTLAFGTANSQTSGDINHMGGYNFNHDESNCFTDVQLIHQTTISNSFLNDSIKFIGWGGQLLYSEANLIGTANWNVMPSFFDGMPISDEQVSGGMLNTMVPSILWKIISGNDTLYNPISFINETITNPCTYNSLSGNVYVDNNSDCVFNAGDLAVSSLGISVNSSHVSPGGNYTKGYGFSTNGVGDFNGTIQESWLTNYQVSLPSIYAFIFPLSTCSPISYTFTTLPQTNVDFAVQCADVDASVYIGSNGSVRPLIPFNLFPNVSNVGCDPVSGTLKLVLDANVTYSAANSSNPATSVNGDTLYWSYSNLTNASSGAFWNSFFGGVQLTPNISVNIGDTLCFKVISDVPVNDINGLNNEMTLCLPVVNSYDPNVKAVEPKGVGSEGFIAPTTSKLRYTVHFQNTGTANAININIIDTLGANVISNTLKIIDASHTMVPEWLGSNIVKFKFNNINLPDSISNEPSSHGYVVFEIDMVQGLLPGTEIKNKVDIYFDFNAPITTNYALNTIEDPLFVEELISNSNGLQVNVYPNPMSDEVNFNVQNKGKTPERLQIKITDLSGKVMLEKSVNNTSLITLQRNQLIQGMYIYEIIDLDSNEFDFGKLLVR